MTPVQTFHVFLSLAGKVCSGYRVSNIENKVIPILGLNEAAAITSSIGNSDSREGRWGPGLHVKTPGLWVLLSYNQTQTLVECPCCL